ncbi:MAG: hypothetical protein ACAI34_20460 [Verrucomicrobium sp.]|nr:hypothetical protein [Verrucomicrobium sp.]
MKHKLLGILLLVLFGIVKFPLEEQVKAVLKEANLVEPPTPLGLRESLGQMSFAATLGGLRSLIASITYLQAYVSFETDDWAHVDALLTLTTRLQPKEASYWDQASWQMAYNAASSYQRKDNLRAAIKNKYFHDYVTRGLDIVKEGLVYLPNNPTLLVRMGEIYRDRLKESRPAAEAFLQAYKNGAKPYYERMAAYELVKLGQPDDLSRAYEILRRHFDNGFRYPSVLRDLKVLEEKLSIPVEKRVGKALPPVPARRK